MKKIDKLFTEFPELKIIELWIKEKISERGKNRIKNLFRNYRVDKPKRVDEMINILKTSNDPIERFRACLYINMVYEGNTYFGYLNKCFSKLKEQEGFRQLLKRMRRNPEEFNDVFSEIEFNAYFIGRYDLKIEPKIKNKKFDSKINLEKRYILFEIFTPKNYKPLEETKQVIEIPNISKSKFLDKLEKQIIPVKDEIKTPMVIVVNASYSVIDDYDIEDSLFGRLRINILRDGTGRIVDEYLDRERNSITDTEPSSKFISAVIIYRRNIHIDGLDFNKKLILNEKAEYQLTLKEYKKLNRFDLNNIL